MKWAKNKPKTTASKFQKPADVKHMYISPKPLPGECRTDFLAICDCIHFITLQLTAY